MTSLGGYAVYAVTGGGCPSRARSGCCWRPAWRRGSSCDGGVWAARERRSGYDAVGENGEAPGGVGICHHTGRSATGIATGVRLVFGLLFFRPGWAAGYCQPVPCHGAEGCPVLNIKL